MATNSFTFVQGWDWVRDGALQNWVVWVFCAGVAVAFSAIAYWMLWIFNKHDAMNPQKRKHFFGLVFLLSFIVILALTAFCNMMNSATRYFSAQVEVIKNDVIQRQKEKSAAGLRANLLNMGQFSSGTNVVTNKTIMSMSAISGKDAKIDENGSGINVLCVIRIMNSGMPSTAWNWKAHIVLVGGTKIEASIPSVAVNEGQSIPTIAGPFSPTYQNHLPDALAFVPLQTGGGTNCWLALHINGLDKIPEGAHFIITFNDVNDKEVRIEHVFTPGE